MVLPDDCGHTASARAELTHCDGEYTMELTERVDSAIDAALVSRIVGCVVLVRQNGREVYARAAGLADREAGRAMARDAIFRLASVTKPIVTTAVLRMIDRGLLRLDDPVTKFLPWFTPRAPDQSVPTVLIRHLLTHTSGITYDVPATISAGLSGIATISLEENLRRLANVPLAFAPGSGWAYGKSIDVLGGAIAEINGSSLEAAVEKYVGGPLGMKDTHFFVTDPERLAVPYADGSPPKRMGEPEGVVDESGGITVFSPGRIFNADAPQSGGAGMAGTADDVMSLLDSYNGSKPLLKPETIAQALSNQIGSVPRRPIDAGRRFSLIGAVVDDPIAARTPCPAGTVEWGGAWGNNWIVDPVNRLTIVICTNVAFEGCNGPFTEEVRDAAYG
jgi:CubicO group peptidase (beta-lactamase class C family)